MSLKWSEESPPNDIISYNHIKCETPIGELVIDWKGWKDDPSYDAYLTGSNYVWIGSESSLEDAKEQAKKFMEHKIKELQEFMG